MNHDVQSTLQAAANIFRLGMEGAPDLVKTGISPFDKELGGLSPGSCAIMAAATNVGKSRLMMYVATHTPEPVGLISVEDPEDVVGGRLFAEATGIDALHLRTKNISKGQEKALLKLVDEPPFPNIKYIGYPIAGKLHEVLTHIQAARDLGCRLIILDYIQEVRGHNPSRKDEVIETLGECHRVAASGSRPAAFLALSQFRRLEDPTKPPSIHHLKESGDLENKARVVILAHRFLREDGKTWAIKFRVAKSTYGRVGLSWDMESTPAGTLDMARPLASGKVSW